MSDLTPFAPSDVAWLRISDSDLYGWPILAIDAEDFPCLHATLIAFAEGDDVRVGAVWLFPPTMDTGEPFPILQIEILGTDCRAPIGPHPQEPDHVDALLRSAQCGGAILVTDDVFDQLPTDGSPRVDFGRSIVVVKFAVDGLCDRLADPRRQ